MVLTPYQYGLIHPILIMGLLRVSTFLLPITGCGLWGLEMEKFILQSQMMEVL